MIKIAAMFLMTTIGCSGQPVEKWVPTCQRHPEYCSKKIIALTGDEMKSLKGAKDKYDAAEKAASAAHDDLEEKKASIIRTHKLQNYPAMMPRRGLWGGVGTCLGQYEFIEGYLVYNPSSDINSCGSER